MNKKIPIAFAFIALIAMSSLSLTFAQTSTVSPSPVPPNAISALSSRSYVRINGVISEWGTSQAKGLLQTQARVGTFDNGNTNQFASATAIWTTNLSRPIAAVASKQNFTYTFYEARLRNATISALSGITSSASDYTLEGIWNVYNVTSNVTIITNLSGQIISVHRTIDSTVQKVDGVLTVTNGWTKFTLTLAGIDTLSGSVVRSVIRQVAFNPFKVTQDLATASVITNADVAAVIQSYGAMPGWGNYDARMDFCNHFKIDLANLATVASNM